MFIQGISIKNFVGLRDLYAAPRPLTLVAGLNGAGKSSTLEAIRYAISGEIQRVKLKKDLSLLVREGNKKGEIRLVYSDESGTGERSINLPDGAIGGSPLNLRAAACYLKPGAFARMDPEDRRAAILEAAGVSCSPEALKRALEGRGVSQKSIAKIAPLLLNVEGAAEEAARMARELKGKWSGITGEKWGAVKAEGWRAPGDERAATPEQIEKLRADRDRMKQAHAVAVSEIARIDAAMKARSEAEARLSEKPAIEQQLAELKKRAAEAEGMIGDMKAREQALADKAGEKPRAEPIACPHCSGLVELKGGELIAFENEIGLAFDAQAAEDLGILRGEIRRAEAEAQARGEKISKLDRALLKMEAGLPDAPQEGEREEAAQALQIAQESLAQAEAKLEAALLASGAIEKTQQATAVDADIREWLRIGELLAPSGVVAEICAPAMRSFAGLLQDFSEHFNSEIVAVSDDEHLAITVAGRPLSLCSESEQWRANAIIGCAFSHLSGARILLLDRMDVLAPALRAGWLWKLNDLATGAQMLDQVIVAATLKSKPESLPEEIGLLWIEGGCADLPGDPIAAAA